MKKSIILSVLFFSACTSPPEPAAFPENVKSENSNTFIENKPADKVPLNRFDSAEWSYSLINHGSALSQANAAKFWYLAHHATKITLYGEKKDIDNLRLLMIAKGATNNVVLMPNCVSTKKNPCSKTVSILFEKGAKKPTVNSVNKAGA